MSRREHGYAAIGLVNPKNPFNVGAALRAVGCFEPAGAALVAYTGKRYTAGTGDTDRVYRSRPLIHAGDRAEDIFKLDLYSCEKVAIEVFGDVELQDFEHPERAFYIFGPEDGSIPSFIMDECQYKVRIPTVSCMNLAATVNVVLWDRLAKILRDKEDTT